MSYGRDYYRDKAVAYAALIPLYADDQEKVIRLLEALAREVNRDTRQKAAELANRLHGHIININMDDDF